MISNNRGKASLLILLLVLFTGASCSGIAQAPTLPPIARNTVKPSMTTTPTTDFSLTADFMETASLKNIMVSPVPTVTDTPTPVPPGIYALSFFYAPLVMNYNPSIWENKNGLHAKNLTSCTINEGGPTDFNGPHSTNTVWLGKINYTVLTFPDTSPEVVSWVYLADEAHATEYGLPVFWVSAKSDEWDECKALAEKVLATLRFPAQ